MNEGDLKCAGWSSLTQDEQKQVMNHLKTHQEQLSVTKAEQQNLPAAGMLDPLAEVVLGAIQQTPVADQFPQNSFEAMNTHIKQLHHQLGSTTETNPADRNQHMTAVPDTTSTVHIPAPYHQNSGTAQDPCHQIHQMSPATPFSAPDVAADHPNPFYLCF